MGNYTVEAAPQAYARVGRALYTITTTRPPRSYRLGCSVTPARYNKLGRRKGVSQILDCSITRSRISLFCMQLYDIAVGDEVIRPYLVWETRDGTVTSRDK